MIYAVESAIFQIGKRGWSLLGGQKDTVLGVLGNIYFYDLVHGIFVTLRHVHIPALFRGKDYFGGAVRGGEEVVLSFQSQTINHHFHPLSKRQLFQHLFLLMDRMTTKRNRSDATKGYN